MQRPILLFASIVTIGVANCQTILFQEDFEGPASAFDLNTTDVGSMAAGANTWLVNAAYSGGDGLANCLGFEIPFTIPSTAGQPIGISTANGNYLHTASVEAVNSGVLCCSFGAADGFCTDPGNHFARMTSDVSTTGANGTTLSFWWLCQGGSANYGEVYYSIDGGSAWTLITTPVAQYRNRSSWAEQVISMQAFDDQATLRFGFRFVNGASFTGAADPGFGIDDVRITVDTSVPAEITTGMMLTTELCEGGTFDLPYTAQGQFSTGNVFSVELSDGAGDFTSPLIIGSVMADASGSIVCTLPVGIEPGSAYRIRVVSSAPAVIGAVNVQDISISVAPSAGDDASIQVCGSDASFPLFDLLGGAPSTCGSWIGPDAQLFSGVFDPSMDPAGSYTYTTDCPGACPQDVSEVFVDVVNALGAGVDVTEVICGNDASFTPYQYIAGGATTGQFFYQGQPFPLPDFTEPGVYEMTYVVAGSSICPADSALFEFTVLAPPNAGTSLNFTICITEDPVELITLLGNADTDGTWVGPSGGPFDGTLIPGTSMSGLYTYTVVGEAPCADAQAFVAVVVDPCAGIAESGQGRVQMDWSGQRGTVHDVTLRNEGRVVRVSLFDNAGKALHVPSFRQQGARLAVDLTNAATGTYTLVVEAQQRIGVVRLVHDDR